MSIIIELGYVLTLLIGVACFTVHITAREKNLITAAIIKQKSMTMFLTMILSLNISDFLVFYLESDISAAFISIIYIVENVLEVGLCYAMICMERDFAGGHNPRWLAVLFVSIVILMVYGDAVYSTGGHEAEESAYVAGMLLLNSIPIILMGYFGLRYWALGRGKKHIKKLDIQMFLYNLFCTIVCVVSTISLIDSRTSSDYFMNDEAIYVVFWFIFNLINLVFLWSFCEVNNEENKAVLTDEERLEKIAEQYGLSEREREIAKLMHKGKNNKEMAELLFLSPNTVKVHASNLYRKLGVVNRVQAAAALRGEKLETEEEGRSEE